MNTELAITHQKEIMRAPSKIYMTRFPQGKTRTMSLNELSDAIRKEKAKLSTLLFRKRMVMGIIKRKVKSIVERTEKLNKEREALEYAKANNKNIRKTENMFPRAMQLLNDQKQFKEHGYDEYNELEAKIAAVKGNLLVLEHRAIKRALEEAEATR